VTEGDWEGVDVGVPMVTVGSCDGVSVVGVGLGVGPFVGNFVDLPPPDGLLVGVRVDTPPPTGLLVGNFVDIPYVGRGDGTFLEIADGAAFGFVLGRGDGAFLEIVGAGFGVGRFVGGSVENDPD